MMPRHRRPRIPERFELPVTFHAVNVGQPNAHVVAVMQIGGSTIGLRFESVDQLMTFFARLIEKAAKVWPDNEWIKEYLSD